jgi:hypothetical protein
MQKYAKRSLQRHNFNESRFSGLESVIEQHKLVCANQIVRNAVTFNDWKESEIARAYITCLEFISFDFLVKFSWSH